VFPFRRVRLTPINLTSTASRLVALTLRRMLALLARHSNMGRANALVAQSNGWTSVEKVNWCLTISYGVQPGFNRYRSSSNDNCISALRGKAGPKLLICDFSRTSRHIRSLEATTDARKVTDGVSLMRLPGRDFFDPWQQEIRNRILERRTQGSAVDAGQRCRRNSHHTTRWLLIEGGASGSSQK
jgi:hypothetical protein